MTAEEKGEEEEEEEKEESKEEKYCGRFVVVKLSSIDLVMRDDSSGAIGMVVTREDAEERGEERGEEREEEREEEGEEEREEFPILLLEWCVCVFVWNKFCIWVDISDVDAGADAVGAGADTVGAADSAADGDTADVATAGVGVGPAETDATDAAPDVAVLVISKCSSTVHFGFFK